MIRAKHKVQLSKVTQPPLSIVETAQTLFDAPAVPTQAQTEIDQLFPEVEPPPLRGCPVCGSKRGKRAHRDHEVCRACTDTPGAIVARLGIAVATAQRDQHAAAQSAQAARAALIAQERDRYDAYMSLRSRADVGDVLSETEQRKLGATNAAYAGDDPRISDALRRCRTADEVLYWANAHLEGRRRDRDVKVATLALALEALGRKADADKLYQEA